MSVKRIVRIAILAAILFVQEIALSFIPNIQLTQCLIAIYYYSFGLLDTLLIVLIHVILDNLFGGSLNLMYTPAMLMGWSSLPILLHIFRKKQNKFFSATLVGLHGIIYCFCFCLANVLVNEGSFIAYLIADIPFEIILIVNGFLTTLLLKDKLVDVLSKFKKQDKSLQNI